VVVGDGEGPGDGAGAGSGPGFGPGGGCGSSTGTNEKTSAPATTKSGTAGALPSPLRPPALVDPPSPSACGSSATYGWPLASASTVKAPTNALGTLPPPIVSRPASAIEQRRMMPAVKPSVLGRTCISPERTSAAQRPIARPGRQERMRRHQNRRHARTAAITSAVQRPIARPGRQERMRRDQNRPHARTLAATSAGHRRISRRQNRPHARKCAQRP